MNVTEEIGSSVAASESHQRNPAAMPFRVAYLTNQIPPYRIPKFSPLGRTPGWEFRVFTCVEREANRQWDVANDLPFHHQRSFSFSYVARRRRMSVAAYEEPVQVRASPSAISPISAVLSVRRGDLRRVRTSQPDCHGLCPAFSGKVSSGLRSYRPYKPGLDGGFRTAPPFPRPSPPRLPLQWPRVTALPIELLGVPPHNIFEIGQALDASPYQRPWTESQRQGFRKTLGISGLCFLFTGRLVPLKGLDRLLEAWGRFTQQAAHRGNFAAGGRRRNAGQPPRARAARAALRNVIFHGFVQPAQMPELYPRPTSMSFPAWRTVGAWRRKRPWPPGCP